MSGSLQIKGNQYYIVLNLYDENRIRKKKWIPTKLSVDGNNKRKAEKELRKVLQEYDENKVSYSKEIDFASWVENWLEKAKYNLELTSWESYESYVRLHIVPYFSKHKVTLSELQPKHIQDYYMEKLKNGRTDGKGGLCANSIKKHNVVIHSALQEALKLNLIPYNPSDRATLPKVDKKFVGSFYNEQQAKMLMNVSAGTVMEPVIILTLYYGLRRSEICGLKWDAIDFDKDTLIVKNTIVKMKTLVEKERTKNKSSYRTLPLLKDVKKYLKELRRKQMELQLLCGDSYVKNDYVCKWEDGRSVKPDFISKKFRQIVKKAGLPHIRFHDMRHTTASLLIGMGFSLKEIQEWLGHSDISTTADIYAHLDYSAKVNMADKLNARVKLSM